MVDARIFGVLSHLVLIVSSGLALTPFNIEDVNFLEVTMLLHMCVGLLGFFTNLTSLLGVDQANFGNSYSILFNIAQVFGFPCVATQLYLHHGHYEVAFFHVASAVLLYCGNMANHDYKQYTNLIILLNVVSAGMLSGKESNTMGIVMSVDYAVCFLIMNNHDKLFDIIPMQDILILLLSLFNYLALQSIK